MPKNPANYPFFTYSTAPSGKSHCSKQIRKPPLQRLTVAEVTQERREQIPSVFSLNMERCRMQQDLTNCTQEDRSTFVLMSQHKLQQAIKQPRAQGHWENGTPKPLSIPIISSFSAAPFTCRTSSHRLNNIKCLAVTVSG